MNLLPCIHLKLFVFSYTYNIEVFKTVCCTRGLDRYKKYKTLSASMCKSIRERATNNNNNLFSSQTKVGCGSTASHKINPNKNYYEHAKYIRLTTARLNDPEISLMDLNYVVMMMRAGVLRIWHIYFCSSLLRCDLLLYNAYIYLMFFTNYRFIYKSASIIISYTQKCAYIRVECK